MLLPYSSKKYTLYNSITSVNAFFQTGLAAFPAQYVGVGCHLDIIIPHISKKNMSLLQLSLFFIWPFLFQLHLSNLKPNLSIIVMFLNSQVSACFAIERIQHSHVFKTNFSSILMFQILIYPVSSCLKVKFIQYPYVLTD